MDATRLGRDVRYTAAVLRRRPYHRPVLAALTGTLALVVVAGTAYAGLWWLDFGGDPTALDPLTLFGLPDAADTIGGLGEVTIAVLGIALTVVAIIVELAANRYTPRVTELFLRDPINAVVLSLFALTAALVVATSMSLSGPSYPTRMVQIVVVAMIVSMLAILPYFIYVFDFLTPRSVVHRIEEHALIGLRRARRARGGAVGRARAELRRSVEQLGEIALNSVQKKDKAIAVSAVQALAEIAEHAVQAHPRLPEAWFDVRTIGGTDQDFVSFHPDIIHRITRRHTWVEVKVLRQFQSIVSESLTDLQDIAHIAAIHTRHLAISAHTHDHPHAEQICFDFLHTYFRAAINGRDVRSAYNIFNEYRALAEELLDHGAYDRVLTIAERFQFYGQLAFSRQLPFILETAAYDLCTLLEAAHARQAPCHDALLDVFLELDREPDGGQHQEASLRGVRKAQVKLATYYLLHHETKHARRIFTDMRDEEPERLASIREEIEQTVEPEFWEVSDRGTNFDWLPPERRALMALYFGWFDEPDAPAQDVG